MKRRSTPEDIERAAQAFENFSGHSARYVNRIHVPDLRTVWLLGTLHHIGYTAKRDGHTRTFEHVFSSHARPHLVVSVDGRQLGIVGGRFHVTDAGITDS